MQLRPEWPWIFRSMCTYLHPYHIYLHVSYILSMCAYLHPYHIYFHVSYILLLSLPHISLCFLCIIFITATYILYFMTTTMIVTESEVFKVHPGAFPNSLSAVQLRDWLSQGCKTIFSLQSSTFAIKMDENETLAHVEISIFLATPPLPFRAGFLLLLVCLLVSTRPANTFQCVLSKL